eukprot:jgi/Mesvir1/2789/Mv13723-RA.2
MQRIEAMRRALPRDLRHLRALRILPCGMQYPASSTPVADRWRTLCASADHVGHHPALHRSPITEQLWKLRFKAQQLDEAGVSQGNVASKPHKLVPKPPRASRCWAWYPFSTDPVLREKYRNPWGYVRMGRLMEDLDAMAGNIAYTHCGDGDSETAPLLIVTASVDRIETRGQFGMAQDGVLSGEVCWVGMEIRMRIHTLPPGAVKGAGIRRSPDQASGLPEEVAAGAQGGAGPPLGDTQGELVLEAFFTFVARDPVTKKAAAINPLVPETPEEARDFNAAENRVAERKARRLANAAAGPSGPPMDPSRMAHMSRLLEEASVVANLPALAPHDAVLMSSTSLQNVIICQPQQRNMHGRIFGGFLMRRAFELAFVTSYTFGGARPEFHEAGEATFHHPVDVGDLLFLSSRVLLTHPSLPVGEPGHLVHVEVKATVMKPEERASHVCNTFEFVFHMKDATLEPGQLKATIKRVLPSTEEEARRHLACLEGRVAQSSKL